MPKKKIVKKAKVKTKSQLQKKVAQPKKAKRGPLFQSPKGMHDILPREQYIWKKMHNVFEELQETYNYGEITTPLVEQIGIFQKTIGESSDIIQKEMYKLNASSGGQKLVLRPEFTAGVARSYIENGMKNWPHPVRLSYFGPCFRHEKSQFGRLRQFHQAGFEIFSSTNDPVYDAEIILVTYRFLEKLKLKNISIKINSIGSKQCRAEYTKKLKSFFRSHQKDLTKEQRQKLSSNPLRLLDSKDKNIQEIKSKIPNILDCLDKDSKKHFTSVLEFLDELKLPYVLDHTLVRGLDYYTNTVFEIVVETNPEDEKAPTFSLAGGGRYDGLVGMLKGKSTPGTGVALGLNRIIKALEYQNVLTPPRKKNKIFFVHIGELAKKKSLGIIENLRNEKIHVVESLGKGSLSAQLGMANKIEAPIAVIFGQKEAYENAIIIRDMDSGAQETVPLEKIATMIKKRMRKK